MREYREVRRQTPDPEAAAPYLGYARELLGQMKTEMARSDIDQLSRTKHLPDGAVVTVRSRFGQDTVSIQVPRPIGRRADASEVPVETRVPPTAEFYPDISVATPTSNGEIFPISAPVINAPTPAPPLLSPRPVMEDLDVEIPTTEPEELPPEEGVKIEEPEQEEVFDEARINYTYWILQGATFTSLSNPAIDTARIESWSPTNGFTGRSIELTTETAAVVIHAGFVWWVKLYKSFSSGVSTIYRTNIATGAQETLYEHDYFEAHDAAATVTPQGVMFAIGSNEAEVVLIGTDGVVKYNNTMGRIGISITAFVNNGVTAFISSGQGADTRHDYEYAIDVATGAYSDNGHDYTAQGDSDRQGPSACMAGGALYGVRVENLGYTDDGDISQAYVYVRSPASNGSSTIGSVGVNTDSQSGVNSSAVAMTLNGTPVAITNYDMSVVDKNSGSISTTSIWNGDDAHASSVSKGTSVIPVGRKIAFMYFNNINGTLTPTMTIYDLASGALNQYTAGMGIASGYLIQYQVFPAINPKPTDLPFLPEWAYLSHTTVNP